MISIIQHEYHSNKHIKLTCDPKQGSRGEEATNPFHSRGQKVDYLKVCCCGNK